jgi:hypothetical protein
LLTVRSSRFDPGCSLYGQGGQGQVWSGSGVNGTVPGSGGGGAIMISGGAATSGGYGAPGTIVITEFLSG